MKMNNLCIKCSYKAVCKYKEDFEEIDSKINFHLKSLLEADKQIFFNIKLECQFFKDELPALQPTELLGDYYITDVSYDPCKNCTATNHKPDLTNTGDSPCDWCYKNPYKVTCLKTNL